MARKKKQTNQGEGMRVQTIEEWLAAGNRITICPPGARSEDLVQKFNGGGRRRTGAKTKKKN